MTFKIIVSDEIEKTLVTLKRKDNAAFTAVRKKMHQIANLDAAGIEHFKNLRGELKGYKRVHIGSFVLIFEVRGDTVIFERFIHHDKAYRQ